MAEDLAVLIKQYALDLRRNASGGDDYPYEIMRGVADYLEVLIKRSKGNCTCAQAGFTDSCDNCDAQSAPPLLGSLPSGESDPSVMPGWGGADTEQAEFECENCIGMPEHGCYCLAVGCIAPCTMPPANSSGDRKGEA